VSRTRFIEAEKAKRRNVAKACELLEVSRSAFYDWHTHRPSARQLAHQALGERIGAIYVGDHQNPRSAINRIRVELSR
jgi:hypothetical protein